jgi:hypothetical protein
MLGVARSRRGWLFACRACARGFMGRGPMQLHLMGRAHGMTMAQAGAAMDERQRAATEQREVEDG